MHRRRQAGHRPNGAIPVDVRTQRNLQCQLRHASGDSRRRARSAGGVAALGIRPRRAKQTVDGMGTTAADRPATAAGRRSRRWPPARRATPARPGLADGACQRPPVVWVPDHAGPPLPGQSAPYWPQAGLTAHLLQAVMLHRRARPGRAARTRPAEVWSGAAGATPCAYVHGTTAFASYSGPAPPCWAAATAHPGSSPTNGLVAVSVVPPPWL